MFKAQIKIPGYSLMLNSNSKQMITRLSQIVDHVDIQNTKEVAVNIVVHKEVKKDCFPIISEANKKNDLEYIQDVSNYEKENVRVIVRTDRKTNQRLLSIIKRDFKNDSYEGHLISRSTVAKGFCMNRFEIHIAGLLYKENYLPLHSAGIVLDGVGFCLIGESGAGKSSTVLQLLSEGAEIISNDFLCIDYTHDVKAYSLDGTIGVRSDLQSKCPTLWEYWVNKTSGKDVFSKENSEQRYYRSQDIYEDKFLKSHHISYFTYISVERIESVKIERLGKITAFKLFMKNRIVVANQLKGEKNAVDIFEELYEKVAFLHIQIPKWVKGEQPKPIYRDIVDFVQKSAK